MLRCCRHHWDCGGGRDCRRPWLERLRRHRGVGGPHAVDRRNCGGRRLRYGLLYVFVGRELALGGDILVHSVCRVTVFAETDRMAAECEEYFGHFALAASAEGAVLERAARKATAGDRSGAGVQLPSATGGRPAAGEGEFLIVESCAKQFQFHLQTQCGCKQAPDENVESLAWHFASACIFESDLARPSPHPA